MEGVYGIMNFDAQHFCCLYSKLKSMPSDLADASRKPL